MSIPSQQPLEIIELLLRPARVAKLAPQFFQDPLRPLGGRLVGTGHVDAPVGIVPVPRRPSERIGVALPRLLVALRTALAGLVAGLFVPLAVALLHLLHLLGHALHA